jgi:hypothetical protein
MKACCETRRLVLKASLVHKPSMLKVGTDADSNEVTRLGESEAGCESICGKDWEQL